MSAGGLIMTPIHPLPHESPYFSPHDYLQNEQQHLATGPGDYAMFGMSNMPSTLSYPTTPQIKREHNITTNADLIPFPQDSGLGISAVHQPVYDVHDECKNSIQVTPEFSTPMSFAPYSTPIHEHVQAQYHDLSTAQWSTFSHSTPDNRPNFEHTQLQSSFADMTHNQHAVTASSAPPTSNTTTSGTTPSLQEAFQFRPILSRQMSASGIMDAASSNSYRTPAPMQHGYFTQGPVQTSWQAMHNQESHAARKPVSASSTPSIQHHKNSPLSTRVQNYHKMSATQTYPPQRRPQLRPSLPENFTSQSTTPKRGRAVSAASIQSVARSRGGSVSQANTAQLPLPAFLPSMLINTPQIQNNSPSFSQIDHMHTHPCGDNSANHTCSSDDGHIPPPASDFSKASGTLYVPVQQDPKFEGDLYTPRYKRRNADNRWEGWCGLCRPGRWLDLKNSRYWEDKYRNHGICARTRTKFADPIDIRWIHTSGSNQSPPAVAHPNITHSSRPMESQQSQMTFVDSSVVNGTVMRREGLCGKCREWVPMDGVRTKARDRAVGWWVHAYECHEKGRKSSLEDL